MTIKKSQDAELSIMQIETGEMEFYVLGRTPLILNRLSQKVKWELLLPRGRKTTADKAATLKHNPIQEFRASPYFMGHDTDPTLLAILPTAFKRGMGTAALDIPGAARTQIGRLVLVASGLVPLYGIPKVFMAVTRSADMNKTPDVRTRAILPEWACTLRIEYVKPILREQSILNLLSAAGFVAGLGDWRQEKGSGSYGAYEIVSKDHPDFVRITQEHGREAQMAAMRKPEAFNDETDELLSWFDVESKRRGIKVVDDMRGVIDQARDDEDARTESVAAKVDGLDLPDGALLKAKAGRSNGRAKHTGE